MNSDPTLSSDRATPQGALRSVKSQLGLSVLVGLREPQLCDGWGMQYLARLSATEQLDLFNEAVAAVGKPHKEIKTFDIRDALVKLLFGRCFGATAPR
ncbi:hypothetical protein DMX02_18020 [Pseudomonas jessenii]|nr:hypothetical protein DMX02_18020 [Pseudomonas jessenii]